MNNDHAAVCSAGSQDVALLPFAICMNSSRFGSSLCKASKQAGMEESMCEVVNREVAEGE